MDFPCKALRCKLWSSSSDFETTRYQEPSLFCDVYNLMTWKECIQCDCEKQNFDPKNFNSGPSVYKTLDTMVFSTCLTDNGRIFLFSCFCYILFLEWEVLWLIFFFFPWIPQTGSGFFNLQTGPWSSKPGCASVLAAAEGTGLLGELWMTVTFLRESVVLHCTLAGRKGSLTDSRQGRHGYSFTGNSVSWEMEYRWQSGNRSKMYHEKRQLLCNRGCSSKYYHWLQRKGSQIQ